MAPTPFASFFLAMSKRSAHMYPACPLGDCRSTPAALMRSAHPVLNRTSARLDDSRRNKQVSGCWFNQFRHRFAEASQTIGRDVACQSGVSQLCSDPSCNVACVTAEQCLDNPRIMIGQRNRGAVISSLRYELLEPNAVHIGLGLHEPQHRPRAMNEQGAQVGVTAPADVIQPRPAVGGILPRH